MYRRIRVQNFRSFTDLEITELRRVNLFAGKNNTGKTTVLEAVFLLVGSNNPMLSIAVGRMRGQRVSRQVPDPIWRSVHHGFDPARPIRIEGQWDDEERPRQLEIQAVPAPARFSATDSAPTETGITRSAEDWRVGGHRLRYRAPSGEEQVTEATFNPETGEIEAATKRQPDLRALFVSARGYPDLASDADKLGSLVKEKREQEVVDALKIIEPSINRLEIVPEAGTFTVYADLGLPSLAPLAVCGEGVVRLFSISVELAVSRGHVLLIDEIDNGLHYSVMQEFWSTLRAMAVKHDVQIFATTHNEELIQSAIRAFQDDLSLLGLNRLERKGGTHIVTSYNEPALRAVEGEKFEVRG